MGSFFVESGEFKRAFSQRNIGDLVVPAPDGGRCLSCLSVDSGLDCGSTIYSLSVFWFDWLKGLFVNDSCVDNDSESYFATASDGTGLDEAGGGGVGVCLIIGFTTPIVTKSAKSGFIYNKHRLLIICNH